MRSSPWTGTSAPTGSRATATRRRSFRSLGSWAARRRCPSFPICCRSTRGCWPAAMSASLGKWGRRRSGPSMGSATRTSRSWSWSTSRPGFATSASTNLCRVHVALDGDRPGARLRRDRQPLEGGGRAGDPEPEPDAGAARDGGPWMTFFRSRWVDAPSGIEELDPAELTPGFQGGGRRLRAQGRRQHRPRPARLRRRPGRLRRAPDPQRRRRRSGAGMQGAVRPRRDPCRGRQLGERQRGRRRARLPGRPGDARRGGGGARPGCALGGDRRDRPDRRSTGDRGGSARRRARRRAACPRGAATTSRGRS